MTTSIETYTGLYFDYENPRAEDVDVRDIARALSMTVRFGGHVSRFYSVAQHALRVSDLVGDIAGPELQYVALHHDSHEAYLGDIPKPLKNLLGPDYAHFAHDLDWWISEALGFRRALLDHDFIKEADALALRQEAAALKKSCGVGEHWGNGEATLGFVSRLLPDAVERQFLRRHDRLRRELGLCS